MIRRRLRNEGDAEGYANTSASVTTARAAPGPARGARGGRRRRGETDRHSGTHPSGCPRSRHASRRQCAEQRERAGSTDRQQSAEASHQYPNQEVDERNAQQEVDERRS